MNKVRYNSKHRRGIEDFNLRQMAFFANVFTAESTRQDILIGEAASQIRLIILTKILICYIDLSLSSDTQVLLTAVSDINN